MTNFYTYNKFCADFTKTLGCKVSYELYEIYVKIAITENVTLSEAVRSSIIHGANVWMAGKKADNTSAKQSSNHNYYGQNTTKEPKYTFSNNSRPIHFEDFLTETKERNMMTQKDIKTAFGAGLALLMLFSGKRK